METNYPPKLHTNPFPQMYSQPTASSFSNYTSTNYQPQPNFVQQPQFSQSTFQPPMTSTQSSGPPSFSFKERKGKLNWDKINAVDLRQIRNGANMKILEACLGNIAFASLDQEDCEQFDDPMLLKMFRLSQYGLEYMLNYQNYLYGQMQSLDMSYKQTEENMKPLEQKARENQAEIQKLKEELRSKKQKLANCKQAAKQSVFKCNMCKKYFKSQGYLDEHRQRRHSETPRLDSKTQRIVLKETSTSPMTPFHGDFSKSLQENQVRTRGVLTEKSVGEDNMFGMSQDVAALEKMKDMLVKVREEDNSKLTKMNEMLHEKFEEILRSNSEIGQRVQQLEQKVETRSMNVSKQPLSELAEEEEDELDKENQSGLANERRRDYVAPDFQKYKLEEEHEEKSAENDIKVDEIDTDQEDVEKEEVEEQENEEKEVNQVEELAKKEDREKEYREDWDEEEEEEGEKQEEKQQEEEVGRTEKEEADIAEPAKDIHSSKQGFRSGDLESDMEAEQEKDNKLEEERVSAEELSKYAKEQVAKLAQYQTSQNQFGKHQNIPEAEELHEDDPDFEDEDERERTMRIIESSMGLRGDEDKALEKDRKAYMKAKETMNLKYANEDLHQSQLEVVEEQVKGEMKVSFKDLFGDDYENLAGRDVLDLEQILGSLKVLNLHQKKRFTQMKDDYTKIQKKDLIGFQEEKLPEKVLTNEHTAPPAQEKSQREEEEDLQFASNKVKQAKETLAELEQIIKESQESQISIHEHF